MLKIVLSLLPNMRVNQHCKTQSFSTYQPSLHNLEASILHDSTIQISRLEKIDNGNNKNQSILESFNEEAPTEH